ncbi:MAG TPA: twin-arginine translocase subunit TatC, partial [Sphingomonadaceae bacterium]|nr:twin-arginine translocase subunit TatC [Sphingomonadaceae bacterium]
VAAFILGAVLTPPDLVSQILLATPMLILFELSLILMWFTERKQAKDKSEAEPAMPDKPSEPAAEG